jgi:pSer/pThr/pTyr-binding forkhead associated (FHA) protein
VSRRHAQLALADDGSWTVTDLGSTNGTFIGATNTKLSPNAETALDPTSPIKIGAYTVIRLEPAPSPSP